MTHHQLADRLRVIVTSIGRRLFFAGTVLALVWATTGRAAADDALLKQYLNTNLTPIDLSSALRLAGLQNSQILLAQQRVLEAVAQRQLAAAQFLPTLNAGTSLDSHRGVLQNGHGQIISVNRDSLYVGAGAFAVGAGSVTIPGVVLTGNVSEVVFNYLISRQEVNRRGFDCATV